MCGGLQEIRVVASLTHGVVGCTVTALRVLAVAHTRGCADLAHSSRDIRSENTGGVSHFQQVGTRAGCALRIVRETAVAVRV